MIIMYCFLYELGNFIHTSYCTLISYNEALRAIKASRVIGPHTKDPKVSVLLVLELVSELHVSLFKV